MSRFERLADNKDLIEKEKASAREEGRQPTRTNVLKAASERDNAEKKTKKMPENPGGFTKERREQRAQIEAIYAGLKSETVIEFTANDLVLELNRMVNGFVSSIRSTLMMHSTLLEGDTRKQVKEVITDAKCRIEREITNIL